jgi:hypothetical protein
METSLNQRPPVGGSIRLLKSPRFAQLSPLIPEHHRMSWRYSILSVLIVMTSIVRALLPLLREPEEVPPEWFIPPSNSDPEGRLAMNAKIAFACADHSTLLLIKGISDTLAEELLASRPAILRAAKTVGEEEALQHAHGVGKKTAKTLLRSLDLLESCAPSETFAPLDLPY